MTAETPSQIDGACKLIQVPSPTVDPRQDLLADQFGSSPNTTTGQRRLRFGPAHPPGSACSSLHDQRRPREAPGSIEGTCARRSPTSRRSRRAHLPGSRRRGPGLPLGPPSPSSEPRRQALGGEAARLARPRCRSQPARRSPEGDRGRERAGGGARRRRARGRRAGPRC